MKTTDQIVRDMVAFYSANGGSFAEAEKQATYLRDMNSEGTTAFAFWNDVCKAFRRAASVG